MTTPERVQKLITKLDSLIVLLQQYNELAIHQTISQFYYMHKREMLALLLKHACMKCDPVKDYVHNVYTEVFTRWQRDARWLNRYLCLSVD